MKTNLVIIMICALFSMNVSVAQNYFSDVLGTNYLLNYSTNPYSFLLFDELLLDNTRLSTKNSKEVLQHIDSLFISSGKSFVRILEGNNLGARKKRDGTIEFYKILAEDNAFYILCAKLDRERCNCGEDLYIQNKADDSLNLVRKLLPFSLKVNLIDRINELDGYSLNVEDFDNTCEVISHFAN